MALLDLLGRRMALRILWELSQARASLTFRALQAAADTNPALLNQRLKELREAGILAHEAGGYRLTPAGLDLVGHLGPLNGWAERWATSRKDNPSPAEADEGRSAE